MKKQEIKSVIKKWYSALNFPETMDSDFEKALDAFEADPSVTLENYNTKSQNGKENLLYFLYFCEELARKYKEKNIPQSILLDTLGDIPVWTKTWSGIKGELYLGELEWLKRHLGMRLFKLGRLQFCIADSEFDIPQKGIAKGDAVVEVHIPEGEPLDTEACKLSVNRAREFFKEFFPQYDYKLFTCHSWLLDASLSEFLSPNSNILKFANMFTVVRNDPSDAIFGYIFKWGTTRREAMEWQTSSSLSEKIKSAVLNDREFYESLGYINKL